MVKSYQAYTKKYFGEIAAGYDFIELVVGGFRKKLAARIGSSRKVLDVACGTGSNAVILAEKGNKVTGIDISPEMLRLAERKAKNKKIRLVEGDASRMRFRDSAFDVSMITFSLHDMPRETGIRVLKEMKRVTKKGGRIFIADYSGKKNFASRIVDRIVSRWETKYYGSFMRHGLESYLEEAKLNPVRRSLHFFGSIVLVECVNEKLTKRRERVEEQLEKTLKFDELKKRSYG